MAERKVNRLYINEYIYECHVQKRKNRGIPGLISGIDKRIAAHLQGF